MLYAVFINIHTTYMINHCNLGIKHWLTWLILGFDYVFCTILKASKAWRMFPEKATCISVI